MTALPKPKLTLEEYFELDNTAEGRYEYFDGEVFEMSGGSPAHAILSSTVGRLLGNQLAPRGCLVYSSEVRLKVPNLPPYRYADASALCGEPIYQETNGLACLINPTLLVEVLSPSTVAFDQGAKFEGYKSIASFREYLLIAQDRKFVVRYLKQKERFWLQSTYGAGEVVPIESLGCELDVDALYQGVNFDSETGF
jgi:Uma2 family endonuclease